MRPLTVSFGTQDKAVITTVKSLSWEELSKALTVEPPERTDKTARGWYIPATFNPVYRHGDNFVSRDAITYDFDHVTIDAAGVVLASLQDIAFAMYTTFSHTYTEPRFRVVVPLSRPVSEDEYQAAGRRLALRFGIALVARESFVPAQMMYLPTRRLGGEFYSSVGLSTDFVDVDKILGEYDDWHDRTKWPQRANENLHEVPDRPTAPDEKPGIVGDFCRRFRVEEAIARFELPYRPGSVPGRYTYIHGSVPDGAIVYDEGLKFHSHHDTDPCRGQHNSFDLVRITRFGHLDAGRPDGLGPGDWPSTRAMASFVLSLPEFRPQAADEFTDMSSAAGNADAQESGGSDAGQTQTVGEVDVDTSNRPLRFVVQSAADFADGPPLDWIVCKLLPRAELAVVYGESGSGKSFFALDLCGAICRGIAWRSRRVAKGRVVYVCAEGAGGFKARLRAYARGHGAKLHELPGVVADAPNLLDSEDAAALYGAILKWGKPDVIVVDTLSAVNPGGNENSGEDMGRILSHCKLLHRHTGALVLLIHHSGKDSTKGARGWSGLRAAADAEIEITRTGDFRTATITKLKDGSDGESFTFKLRVVELDPLNDEPQSSCIVDYIEAPAHRVIPRKRPTGNALAMLEVLEVMAPSGTVNKIDLYAGYCKKLGSSMREAHPTTYLQRLIVSKWAYAHDLDRIGLTPILEKTEGDWLE